MTEERARIEEELGGREERLDCVEFLGIVESRETEIDEVSRSIGLGDATEKKNEWREPGVEALIY